MVFLRVEHDAVTISKAMAANSDLLEMKNFDIKILRITVLINN